MAEQDSRKRLGRGLAALIGDVNDPDGSPQDGPVRADRVVPIETIQRNEQNPRRQFDSGELAELAESVSRHGIVQPILVRPVRNSANRHDDIQYEIIAGERRWRAAQLAKLHSVPVVIREAGDREALELAIIENVQRSDLNAIEEAAGYQQLLAEHGYSQAELGRTIGKSRSHITNTLRLLKLPDQIRAMVLAGELSAGHARTLVTAQDPVSLAKRIVNEGLSVRQAELLQQDPTGNQENRSRRSPVEKSADIRALEKELEDKLGLRVDIGHRASGSGTIRIEYRNIDQLDGLCRRISR